VSRILLGVSGGVAAYKALELVRLATTAGNAVRVVQTPASRRFVGAASFAALSGAPVLVSEFERDPARGAFPDQRPPNHEPPSHLELVANADVYLIAPASANTIAKLANGLADNLLTSCALAAGCPVVLAPAMNNRMFEHPATQANLQTLRERGVLIVEPGVGRLAAKGEEGVGRMAEPPQLLAACEAALGAEHNGSRAESSENWRGLKVLVTAGGTREPIDGVRFLGNHSSGRMGIALARAARARGAEVTLVAANLVQPVPPDILQREVVTAAELKQACEEEFPACDVLLMAAAVADFRPAAPKNGKIKRAQRTRLELVLEPTDDVLAGLAKHRRNGQTLVGFAAEYGERAAACGREKLVEKGVDAVVVNDISRPDIGFDAEANEVTIIARAEDRARFSEQHVPRASKASVAETILDAVERLRASR
jgi:phosphopantothenoylcysteine decarboxylase / phosphopantothenate---cysteine ligase